MPELQNGAGREAQEARGNPENPGVNVPPVLKTIDHLVDNGYGIYHSVTGKLLMFVPRDELLAAPDPVAYFQAILDQVAASFAKPQSSVVPVEVPENLIITEHAGARRYAIRLKANGEVLKVVPWDNLPSDRAAAAQCMQWHVNDAAGVLKHHQAPKRRSAGRYVATVIAVALSVNAGAAFGSWVSGAPYVPTLISAAVAVGTFLLWPGRSEKK